MTRLWRRFSPREKALVGLAIVVFLIVVGRFSIVSPLLERREWIRAQLEAQPKLLEKNIAYLGRREKITTSLAKLREAFKIQEPLLLWGDTNSVRASELQQVVQALAVRHNVQVITTRVLNPEPVRPLTKITIQMEVGGQIDQVSNLLQGIDSADKLLVIDELNVRSLISRVVTARSQNASQPPTQSLRASVIVSGFAWAELPAGNGAAHPTGKEGADEPPAQAPRLR